MITSVVVVIRLPRTTTLMTKGLITMSPRAPEAEGDCGIEGKNENSETGEYPVSARVLPFEMLAEHTLEKSIGGCVSAATRSGRQRTTNNSRCSPVLDLAAAAHRKCAQHRHGQAQCIRAVAARRYRLQLRLTSVLQ